MLGRTRSAHVVDVTHPEGLLDMITLGSFIELSRPLDERLYTKESIPQDEQDEINAAQTRYRRFITWYQERFLIVISGELINPSYIFHRRLVDFAATIVMYVKQQQNDFHKGPVGRHTLTELAFTKHVLNHFGQGWAELSATFLEVKKNPSPRLYYDGPEIRILARKPDWRRQFAALHVVEKDEWSLAPLRVPALHGGPPGGSPSGSASSSGEDDMDVDEDEEDDDDEEDEDENEDDAEEEEESDDVIDISSSDSDNEESSSLSSMECEVPAAPTTAPGAPSTPPPLKRRRTSPASTPSKSPSSSHPTKRQR